MNAQRAKLAAAPDLGVRGRRMFARAGEQCSTVLKLQGAFRKGRCGVALGRINPVEIVGLDAQLAAIREALADGRRPPAGGLLGLPALAGDDIWVDTAGAAAVVGVPPTTITSWLSRGRPATRPFPAAHRYLRRLYWPLSVVEEWARDHRPTETAAQLAALKPK